MPAAEPTRNLASRIRASRERLGLTTRELARRTGIPVATLSAVENGREPRWSTLMRLLEVLPGLHAADLLSPGAATPPLALGPAAWEVLAQIHGISAERIVVAARLRADGQCDEELRIDGLRALNDDAAREGSLRALMQAACIGGPAFQERLLREPVLGRSLDLSDGATRHRFRWTSGPRPVLSYRATTRRQAGSSAAVQHRATIPVRELILEARAAPRKEAPAARLLAWSTVREHEGADASIADALHCGPKAPRIRRAGRATRIAIDHVAPGTTLALDLDPTGSAAQVVNHGPGVPARPRSFAPIAAALREMSACSGRELARAMGVSPATLRAAEAARDPRLGTLQGYLRALPLARPQWLLPALPRAHSPSRADLHDWHRRLHGIVVDELISVSRAHANGLTTRVVEFRGLRADPAQRRELALILARSIGIFAHGPETLDEIETDLAEHDERQVRAHVVEHHPTLHRHVIRIPASLAARGLTLRLHLSRRGAPLEAKDAMLAHFGAETIVRGSTPAIAVPCRRFRLRVELDGPCAPDEIWPVAFSSGHPPRPFRWGSALGRVADQGPEFRASPDGRSADLVVESPLCGLSYGIAWAFHLGEPWANPALRGAPERPSASRSRARL